ncbi:MAG TPA: KR domain-containing protein [Streptosporangiaceae bacterium]
MSTVLIIGAGDLGERFAAGLAAAGQVRRLVLVSRSGAAEAAATIASSHDCVVESVAGDARRPGEVAKLIFETDPDLIVVSASSRGPFALADRDDEAARAITAAGFALRLPYNLPVPLAVMQATVDTGYQGPVANVSFPDVTGPVLARLGLAPTVGLGNAAMILLRARSVLRAAGPEAELPLLRVLAHHAQLGAVRQSRRPDDPAARARVYVGDDGVPDDALAYQAPPLAPSPVRSNFAAAASSIPVLHALLPGAGPLRWSTPSPHGLPGGYPVLIDQGEVSLDLPPGVTEDQAVRFNEQQALADGVERIDEDGTVHFTEAARETVAAIDPGLADPLEISALAARADQLDAALR